MSSRLVYLRTLARESPVGVVALVMAVVCGSLFLALSEMPSLAYHREFVGDRTGWVIVPGSGIALVLVLYSLALERRLGPAWAAGLFLLVVENLALILMPVWTAMVFAGKSSWLMASYLLALFIALILLARRLVARWAANN